MGTPLLFFQRANLSSSNLFSLRQSFLVKFPQVKFFRGEKIFYSSLPLKFLHQTNYLVLAFSGVAEFFQGLIFLRSSLNLPALTLGAIYLFSILLNSSYFLSLEEFKNGEKENMSLFVRHLLAFLYSPIFYIFLYFHYFCLFF